MEKESSEILEWIGEKEIQWEQVAENDFEEISIDGEKYDPFDVEGINAVLEPKGLIYGAGYVHSLKPTFFLAYLEDKMEIEDYTVYILGRELARDLFTVPALSQENCILVRKESAKLFLWDQIFFIKESGRKALRFGLENYGLKMQDPELIHRNLARISAAEMHTYIYHEVGEIRDTVFQRDIWREIIATFPHTPTELLARTVKDILADTNEHGTLQYIVRERKTASLAFYVAFLDGLRKELFPQIIDAFQNFSRTHQWPLIDKAISDGHDMAKEHAETMIEIFRTGKKKHDMNGVENEIESRLLAPLNTHRH